MLRNVFYAGAIAWWKLFDTAMVETSTNSPERAAALRRLFEEMERHTNEVGRRAGMIQ
jgi:hypothetical protein